MAIVVGIDGTGPFFDSTYTEEFKDSFVRKICPDQNPNKQYYRGPIGPGGGLIEAVNNGYNYIIGRYGWAGRDNRILLTGYSRGGLGVLVIAERLKAMNINVAAMMLFDAVDRHAVLNAPTVPSNVAEVLHVRRHPDTKSRESFGNCGTQAASPMMTKYKEEYFNCTHGGVGGTPWKADGKPLNTYIYEGIPDYQQTMVTYGDDAFISGQVHDYVKPFVKAHGFSDNF